MLNAEIHLIRSVTEISSEAFFGCNGITSISVASGNTKYDSRNNCNAIIEKSSKKLMTGCVNTVIPEDVVTINNGAFYDCDGLTSITIPNSVQIVPLQVVASWSLSSSAQRFLLMAIIHLSTIATS